jgi:hypothetical protein
MLPESSFQLGQTAIACRERGFRIKNSATPMAVNFWARFLSLEFCRFAGDLLIF